MFPDASDEHWGSFLTQVPQGELDRGIPVDDYDSRASGFPEWYFQGVTAAVGDGGQGRFAMVSTFKRLECLLRNGVHLYTDHRNL